MLRFGVIDQDTRRKAQIVMMLASLQVYCGPFDTLRDFIAAEADCDILLLADAPDHDFASSLRQLTGGQLHVKTVVYSDRPNVEDAADAMRLGAIDYRAWPFEPKSLIDWLAHAVDDFMPLANLRSRAHLARQRLAPLSTREATVLHAMADGHSNKAIALSLGVSHRTIEAHRLRLLRKIEVDNSNDAIRLSVESRLFDE